MSRKTLDIRLEKKKEETKRTLHAINAVKMVSLLVLRNEGWGKTRLQKFSNRFNTLLEDVSNGHLSLEDILETIKEETGITVDDLFKSDN